MAAEKLNPRPSPFLSPRTPKRFGPTRLGPPFSKVWQAAHFFAAAAPFSTEAVCNSFSIGSDGAGAASLPPAGASSLTAISKPGFSGILGANSAPAVKLVTNKMRQVPRIAPRILLSSKESISDQAPGRKVDFRPEGNGRGCIRNRAFAPHPEPRSDIGLPVLWQPVYMRRLSPDPHHFNPVINRLQTARRC